VLDVSPMERGPALSGYVAVRATRRSDSTTFAIARARVTFQMRPLPYAAVRVQGEFANRLRDTSTAAFALTDAYLQLTPADSGSLTRVFQPALLVGQFRTPFSLEYLTSFSVLRTPDRAHPTDTITTRRDIGLLGQLGFGRWIRMTGAVVNGSGSNNSRNPDNRELVTGRLTLLPWPALGLSGKWEGEGDDHRWGYDGRWVWKRAIVEGEALRRRRTSGAGTDELSGGYALAAYRVLPWLQPAAKWERLRHRSGADTGGTWTTLGTSIMSGKETLRLQLAWTRAHLHPEERTTNEIIGQLIAIF
jgi:phosphate-selective porin